MYIRGVPDGWGVNGRIAPVGFCNTFCRRPWHSMQLQFVGCINHTQSLLAD